MKCFLIAAGRTELLLGPVLDRPYLQHVVEQLVGRGVKSMRILLQRDKKEVRDLLGDGSRWGFSIEYRLSDDEPTWSDLSAAVAVEKEGMILAGNSGRLPKFPSEVEDAKGGGGWPAVYFDEEQFCSRWTGWVLMNRDDLAAFAASIASGLELRDALRKDALRTRKVFLEGASLSCESEKELLRSNRVALEGQFPGLFFRGNEVLPGVWMARAAKVPQSVTFHAPCYIGEEAWIGAGCEVGPHAVIGPRCIVGKGTAIARSVISADTYVGAELEVKDSLASGERLHNVRLGTELRIEESHILCGMARKR